MNQIGIFSVPRSGSTWIGQIFNSSPDVKFSYQPMFAELFRDRVGVRSTAEELEAYLDEICHSEDDFLSQKDDKKKPSVLTFPKHSGEPDFFVFKEVMFLYMIPVFLDRLKTMKVIYIMRDPLDVLTSWYNAPREFYPEWDIHKEWRFAQSKMNFLPERYYGYQKWEEAAVLAREMMSRYPDRFHIVYYEDIDREPEKYTRELFDFAGLEMTEQTLRFLADSKSKTVDDPYSVFRNDRTRNDNRKELPKQIQREVNRRLNEFIDECGWELLRRYTRDLSK